MTLQEKIQEDFKKVIKCKLINIVSPYKILVGELQRQPKKELSDNEVVAIVKKLVKYENENPNPDPIYLSTLEDYLPKQASKEEIKSWIVTNVDLSQFKNKMQAMKPIMQHFGSTVDGKTVKAILEEF